MIPRNLLQDDSYTGEINREDFITNGIVFLSTHNQLGGDYVVDVTNHSKFVLGSGAVYRRDQFGSYLYFDATDDDAVGTKNYFTDQISTAITSITRMRWPTTGGAEHIVIGEETIGWGYSWKITNQPWNTNHDPRFNVDGNSTGLGAIALSNSYLDPVWLVGRWQSGGPVSLYVYSDSAELLASDTTGNVTTTLSHTTGGGDMSLYMNNGSGYGEHHHYLDAVWNRRLSDYEVLQIINNYKILLEPNTNYGILSAVAHQAAVAAGTSNLTLLGVT